MFNLLKKGTYDNNPPPFSTRLRWWYLDNVERGRNGQMPRYHDIHFMLIIIICISTMAIILL